MTPREKEDLVRKALESMDGRDRLRVPNPLAGFMPERMNYASIADKVFQVEQLPEGALPIYSNEQCEVCTRWVQDLKGHSPEECDRFVVALVLDE